MAVVAIAEESQLPALVGTISRTFSKRLCKKCEQSVKTEGSAAPAAPSGGSCAYNFVVRVRVPYAREFVYVKMFHIRALQKKMSSSAPTLGMR